MFDTRIKLISKCALRCVKRVSKVPALFSTYSPLLSTRLPSSTPFGWGGLKKIIIPSLSPLLIYSHIPCARTTSSTPPLPLASSHLLAPPMWSHHLIHSICLGGIKKNNHPVLLASSPPAMVCYARLTTANRSHFGSRPRVKKYIKPLTHSLVQPTAYIKDYTLIHLDVSLTRLDMRLT